MTNPDRLIAAYINVRNQRSQLKKEFESKDAELKRVQDRFNNELLRLMNEQYPGSDKAQFSCDAGTAFKTKTVKYSCEDWTGFYEWMYNNRQAEMLTRSIKQSAVDQYLEDAAKQHEEGGVEATLPPGIRAHTEFTVNVRAPTNHRQLGERADE